MRPLLEILDLDCENMDCALSAEQRLELLNTYPKLHDDNRQFSLSLTFEMNVMFGDDVPSNLWRCPITQILHSYFDNICHSYIHKV